MNALLQPTSNSPLPPPPSRRSKTIKNLTLPLPVDSIGLLTRRTIDHVGFLPGQIIDTPHQTIFLGLLTRRTVLSD